MGFFVREQMCVKTCPKDIFVNIKQNHKNNWFSNNTVRNWFYNLNFTTSLFTLFGIKTNAKVKIGSEEFLNYNKKLHLGLK